MNIKKNFATLLCLIALSGCAKVSITDREFCGDMGSEGASCFKTLSGETRDIPPNEWDDFRFGMVCSKPDTFAEWKKALLKLCSVSKRCKFETKKKINKFGKMIETFQVKLNE